MPRIISKFIVTLNRLSHRAKAAQFLFLCLSCLLFACSASLYLGSDVNWDLRNYHFYNAWALLNNRSEVDFFTVGLHTYLQPLLDVPYYWLSFVWFPDSPKLVTFLMGIPGGIFLSLTCLIIFAILKSTTRIPRITLYILPIPFMLFGISNSFFWELGSTHGDIHVACFLLGSIYALLYYQKRPIIASIISGILIGIAVGLKLTAAVYSIPFLLAIPFFFSTKKMKIQTSLLFAFSCGIGFLMIHGWWSWRLFSETGNPVFPIFDNIYPKWAPHGDVSKYVLRQYPDLSWRVQKIPDNLLDKLSSIFALYHLGAVSICIGFFLFLFILKKWIYTRNNSFFSRNITGNVGQTRTRTLAFLIVLYYLTLLLWRWYFLSARYIIALDAISGIIVLLGILQLFDFKKKTIPYLICLSISILAIMKIDYIKARLYSPKVYRNLSFYSRHTGEEPKPEIPTLPDNTLVLTGLKTSILAPYLSQKTPSLIFIGTTNASTGKGFSSGVIMEKITRKIKMHNGPVYFMVCIADSGTNYKIIRDKNGIPLLDGRFIGEINNFPQYELSLRSTDRITISNKFGIFLLIPTHPTTEAMKR